MQLQYDVVILGAGINGLAIAKAMSEKNKSVLVLEKNSIAYGASSHSSRLIHGGLRYLENFEFSLVKEALKDQKYLLDTYPNLVKLRPFYMPIYKDSIRKPWIIRLGLWIYEFFSKHNKKSTEVTKDKFLREFIDIKGEDLVTVFKYYDAKTNDYELTYSIADEAKELGAKIVENVIIERIDIRKSEIDIITTQGIVKTNTLINATGAWVNEINKKFGFPCSYSIEKLSGIHLVINKVIVHDPLILETSSRRIFFIIPEKNTTLIGTTERSENTDVDNIQINNEDVDYLLKETNRYLKIKLTKSDIKDVFIGTRPLIKTKKEPTNMSREYKLDLHHIYGNKILHIYGGKLTTFPSLARRVVKLLLK